MHHGNGVSARANRKAVRKYSDTKQGISLTKIKTRRKIFVEKMFMRVEEVAETLDVSVPYAYKLIRQLNAELKKKGSLLLRAGLTASISMRNSTTHR